MHRDTAVAVRTVPNWSNPGVHDAKVEHRNLLDKDLHGAGREWVTARTTPGARRDAGS